MEIFNRDSVIVPDVHGRAHLLEAIVKQYVGDVALILAGDLVDGPDSKGVLDIVADQPAEDCNVILGNHDLVLDASLHATDDTVRIIWAEEIWAKRRYHDRVLESYGVDGEPGFRAANQLRTVMPSAHHEIFKQADLYAETEDAIIVHAGLTSDSWAFQKVYLDGYNRDRREGEYHDHEPPQLTGIGVMSEEEVRQFGDLRRLITGHWHVANGHHVLAEGRLIHLANRKNADELPVWESWRQRIRMIRPLRGAVITIPIDLQSVPQAKQN